jgi:hypothetical protein
LCNNDVLYICIFGNKFDLKLTIRVLHSLLLSNVCKQGQNPYLKRERRLALK